MTYKIGITTYDNDHQLWETHIGNANMELIFSVWGKSETLSKVRAELLLTALLTNTNYYNLNKQTDSEIISETSVI